MWELVGKAAVGLVAAYALVSFAVGCAVSYGFTGNWKFWAQEGCGDND